MFLCVPVDPRDPGADGYFWCYTTDPEVEKDSCEIPLCPGKESNELISLLLPIFSLHVVKQCIYMDCD